MSEFDGKIELSVDDQASPALHRLWLREVLSDEYVGSALAHEGIEPADDVVARIAGDLRERLVQARYGRNTQPA